MRKSLLAVLALTSFMLVFTLPCFAQEQYVNLTAFNEFATKQNGNIIKLAEKFKSFVANSTETAKDSKDTITMNLSGTGAWIGVLPEGKDIVINAKDFSWNVNASGTAAAGSTTQTAAAAANSQVGGVQPITAQAQANTLPVEFGENGTKAWDALETNPAGTGISVYGVDYNGVFYPGETLPGVETKNGILQKDPQTGKVTFSER